MFVLRLCAEIIISVAAVNALLIVFRTCIGGTNKAARSFEQSLRKWMKLDEDENVDKKGA